MVLSSFLKLNLNSESASDMSLSSFMSTLFTLSSRRAKDN